jgi:Glyoxalase-like domain
MARGLDHIVHAVRDLDAAAALYRGLGFTVGARNRHSRVWGTLNHIVQLPGTYIELLGLGDTSGTLPHSGRYFSFGAFNRDFLTRGEGLSMLALEGAGVPDAEAFREAGIGDFEPYDFERQGRRPDGAVIKLAFTLAFALIPQAPETGFFTCQQHHPENFWDPAFQKHANGATSVAGVVFVAEEPEQLRGFMEIFSGAAAATAKGGFVIMTPRGAIEAATPAAFVQRFGVTPPDVARGPRLAAVRFATADASLLQNAPEFAGMAGLYAGNGAVIGREDAMGAVLVFEPSR